MFPREGIGDDHRIDACVGARARVRAADRFQRCRAARGHRHSEFARRGKNPDRVARLVLTARRPGAIQRTPCRRGRSSRLLRGTNLYVVARTGNAISLATRPRVAIRPTRAAAAPKGGWQAPGPKADAAPPVRGMTRTSSSPARYRRERRLDAGLAVTTASLEQIHELAPNNTADLLKLAPGIWAETTGGATGANVFVRGFPTTGDAPFLTVQLDGAPIFPPTELAFSENTTLFRIDDMIDRVEILRGGTSPIFSNGQPGAVISFIQRTGTPSARGRVAVHYHRLWNTPRGRYLTGPLALDTVFAVGGFYPDIRWHPEYAVPRRPWRPDQCQRDSPFRRR